MKYIVDHDLHIHSKISDCSQDPEQTNERLLRYAEENGFKTICLTNHFWDEHVEGVSEWYEPQDYNHISAAKPLPQSENVRFLFGCETELDKFFTLALSQERVDLFDFIAIPTTHFHMEECTLTEEDLASVENRAKAWVKRFDYILNLSLPFHKIGFAHLTCNLIAPERKDYLKVLNLLPSTEMERLFKKAASLGAGIELNARDMRFSEEEAEIILRPYRIAKACGCKFYCGSDAHRPQELDQAKALFEKAVTLLRLEETDKFII